MGGGRGKGRKGWEAGVLSWRGNKNSKCLFDLHLAYSYFEISGLMEK